LTKFPWKTRNGRKTGFLFGKGKTERIRKSREDVKRAAVKDKTVPKKDRTRLYPLYERMTQTSLEDAGTKRGLKKATNTTQKVHRIKEILNKVRAHAETRNSGDGGSKNLLVQEVVESGLSNLP